MRKILNISLPPETVEQINKGRYASVSEYIRAALRVYHEEITVRNDHRERRIGREFQQKRSAQLRSMRDWGI